MGYSCLLCKKPSYKRYKAQATFHAFPKCPIQRRVWMNICNVTNLIDLRYRKICSFHFEPECYEKNTKRRLLKPDAIPTIFVKRFMKKYHYDEGILEESPNAGYIGRNTCILCVKSDINYSPKSKIPLHQFPSCPERRQEWINRCQLKDEEVSRTDKICALHFKPECYKPEGPRWLLLPDAVPTVFEVGRYFNRRKPSSPGSIRERTPESN
ncbi:uncharacterized protein LOC114128757 isoform X2 [Aphis gossypii]|uniref:uncharacterized protein LOC114128757 isoform X2 n=1 Tax=Aphis gossypii TaxID=80765 RepID=UPI00100DA009|nr:uncharacterized protein LOC114128757 isoform X2 [Aphis gossypii]